MISRCWRIALLLAATAVLFVAVVLVGLRLLPEPHSEMDYLVAGGVATLVAMALLFAVLITTWVRSPNIFFKRRPEDPED
jgi:Na+/proline symporter